MRSLLITIAGCPRTPSDFIPDNGLALLASIILDAGHQVKILDYNTTETLRRLFPEKFQHKLKKIAQKIFLQSGKPGPFTIVELSLLEKRLSAYQQKVFYEIGSEIADLVEKERIDLVGLKLWNGDGFTASLAIANVLKKRHPRLAVFAGGPHVDTFRENIYKVTSNFDGLAFGEGEETILGLIDVVLGKKSLHRVPNLIFKEDGRVITTPQKRVTDLNSLPFANYDPDVYPAMNNNGRLNFLVIDESRGCNFQCYFCPHPVKSGRLRTKKASRVVEEMAHYQRRYGTRLFRYGGSNTPPDLMEEVAREILAKGLKVEYTGSTDLRREDFDFPLLKRSGCFGLFFGVESADAKILKEKMNKKASPELMREILKKAKKEGVFSVVSFIFPAPGQTEENRQKNLEFLLQTTPNSMVVQFPGLFPETEWFKNSELFGFEIYDKDTYAQKMMDYKIRLFFPPRFWDPLPYKVNGKDFRQFSKETEDFMWQVEKGLKIDVSVSDDLALMAKYLHTSPKDFRDQARLDFFTGNAEGLQKMIETINLNSKIM